MKNTFSIIIALMVFSCTTDKVAELEAENVQLKRQIENLEWRLDSVALIAIVLEKEAENTQLKRQIENLEWRLDSITEIAIVLEKEEEMQRKIAVMQAERARIAMDSAMSAQSKLKEN